MIDPEAPAADLLDADLAILRALEDQRWRTSAEIVDDAELLPLAVRSILKALAGRGLVQRGMRGVQCGHWQITSSGVVKAHRQRV
ncbi:MAG: hypothetical protein ACRDNK_21120 [Solirubrobacteraceae bacterium]